MYVIKGRVLHLSHSVYPHYERLRIENLISAALTVRISGNHPLSHQNSYMSEAQVTYTNHTHYYETTPIYYITGLSSQGQKDKVNITTVVLHSFLFREREEERREKSQRPYYTLRSHTH